jgi:NAD(P)-dependent dehydrogenase (short-subunit alcohol dehydrogenase family)
MGPPAGPLRWNESGKACHGACAEKLDLDLDRFRPTTELTEEDYDSMFDITRGVNFTLQEAAKRLEDDGCIISISTAGTAQAMAGGGAYAGSKAAVEQFSRELGRNSARAASRSTPSPPASPTPTASSWSRSRSTN